MLKCENIWIRCESVLQTLTIYYKVLFFNIKLSNRYIQTHTPTDMQRSKLSMCICSPLAIMISYCGIQKRTLSILNHYWVHSTLKHSVGELFSAFTNNEQSQSHPTRNNRDMSGTVYSIHYTYAYFNFLLLFKSPHPPLFPTLTKHSCTNATVNVNKSSYQRQTCRYKSLWCH